MKSPEQNFENESMHTSSSGSSLPLIHEKGMTGTPTTPKSLRKKKKSSKYKDSPRTPSSETPKKKKSNNIASFDVFARFRSTLQKTEGSVPTVTVRTSEHGSNTTLQFLHNNYELKRIDVNQTAIFNKKETQEDIYQSIGSHYVSQMMSGSNMSMIFYGKVGSGKTYTAGLSSETFSANPRSLTEKDGMTKRLLHDAYSRAKSFGNHSFFSISMVEVTPAGKLIDLLNENHSSKIRRQLMLKGNFRYFPLYDDETEPFSSRSRIVAPSLDAACSLISRGIKTVEQDKESVLLSHIIVFLHFTQGGDRASINNTSTICIADLKGTRRADRATDNLRDVIKVNRSLSFLSNVFSEMRKKGGQYEATFRSHTLTKVLKYLLLAVDRHAHVAVIVCCNTSRYDLDENISALRIGGIVSKIRSSGGKILSPSNKRHAKREPNEFISNLKIKELNDQLRTKNAEIKQLKQRLKDQLTALTLVPNHSHWVVDANMMEQGKKMASGMFGDVFSGRVMVCLKDKQNISPEMLKMRFNVLQGLDHPCVLKYLGFTESGFFIMEYCENGNLYDYISNHKLDNPLKYRLSLQIAEAMDYLHSHGVMNRGLRASAVLLDKNLNAKLSDIDIVDRAENGEKIDTQERSYTTVAPELFYSNQDQLVDIYSYGILLYQIWIQKTPFSNLRKKFESQKELLNHIHAKSLRPSFEDTNENTCPQRMKDLMQACWAIQPQDRHQSFKEIVKVILSWHEDLFTDAYLRANTVISELKALVRRCVEADEIDYCTNLLKETKSLQMMINNKPSPQVFIDAVIKAEGMVSSTRSELFPEDEKPKVSKTLTTTEENFRPPRSSNSSRRSAKSSYSPQ